MSSPTVQVLIGFQTTSAFGTPFQLDNATYGKLDTGTLGGFQMVDMTAQVTAIQITRGRNRQSESFNAGTASLTLVDPTRQLDPLNTASIYYPYVAPRQPVQILAGGVVIYTGVITDWNLAYDFVTAGNVTSAKCSDAFTVLANGAMNGWTPVEQLSNARVAAVLNLPEVAYQGSYSVGTGSSTLGAYGVPAGTNVLSYLQNVAASEQGYLFMSANGTVTFTGRASLLNPVSAIAWTDDGTGIPYSSLTNQYGDELLYNYVQTQSPAYTPTSTAPSLAYDLTSIATYQSQIYSKLDLLNSTIAETAALGQYVLGRYMNPVLRFTGVSSELGGRTAAQQATILAVDLTSIATVQKSFSTGTPASVTQTLIVSGISHTIRPGSHIVNFTFESADTSAYFTLDDAFFGRLDYNLLAF